MLDLKQGLFAGKRGVITGVANADSIAWAIARFIMEQGGECGFTHLPDRPDDERQRNQRRVRLVTEKYPQAKFLMPMNVQKDEDIHAVVRRARQEFGRIDFLLHSIAYADREELKKETIDCSREGFLNAVDISAFSLLALCGAFREIMSERSAVLAMSYLGGEKCVPGYNIMGVCKATLDAAVRYAAYELGPKGCRVNAISAGPVRTLAGRAAGVDDMLKLYGEMAPLGRNITHDEVGHSGAFLLSDLADGITGEIVHLDGGYHMMGSPGRLLDRVKAGG